MSSSSPDNKPSTSNLMRAAVAGSALLVVAGLAAFWYASNEARKAPPKTADNAVTVTIQGNACDPNEITVPAGRTTFTIVNKSNRALEWEILDGVMVVEERENIAPGFSQTMTVKLQPGEFAITCGLLSNPRGKLVVTPSAASDAEAARPSLVNYVGALAEYQTFLRLEAGSLEDAVSALSEAIKAGDLQQARALYTPAHQAYKRIEPMAELFADLDTRINARADYFEKREADAGFTGFHRIEYALYSQNDVKGLAPVVDKLAGDIGALKERLRGLNMPPERLAGSASKLLRRVADNLPAGGEDHYGHAEVANLQGTYEGTKKISELLQPLLVKAAPALQKSVDERFAAFDAALAPYREGDGFKSAPLDEAQRKALAEPVRALAEELGKVNAALGLE
ncbi:MULTISPECIES: iron uptake system protein EfeO [Variovorax]|jgi:iron uptake system component EfeO|uniref:iron uptake system protein EfeO n=1 Tax=Variovorax TaxID=34072 RepID=UPI00086EADDD|nr:MULTISPECIES: iron uptake system protein EfeO [Variovorax]MBN8756419.1 iron uptake system protein EfeO [Variovorax sp.]ODU14440.1 MAG: multidrug DMT transporter permease [Variovorax sp. SCN 67-85]ODV18805.1 MAG: multidrug DMT transporter permease [Variovorax sp. SCN 67-20]OJZ02315.1 MAG: multidrug DMT transporter permease [Variovorax sp. 67-131]UKI10273.1 iron uptake system protein EfeO [Variovorax paradoxus]